MIREPRCTLSLLAPGLTATWQHRSAELPFVLMTKNIFAESRTEATASLTFVQVHILFGAWLECILSILRAARNERDKRMAWSGSIIHQRIGTVRPLRSSSTSPLCPVVLVLFSALCLGS